MYYVKVEGKTLKDLKQGLERHLQELGGYEQTETVNVRVVKKLVAVEDDAEEMEEVESPYTDTTTAPITSPKVLDSEGIPWDSRIHASSKAKVANGTWRTKRGADENEVYKIKAELRGGTPTIGPAYIEPAPSYVQPSPVVAQAAPVVTPIAAPLPPMQNSGHTVDTFKANFALVIANLITEGKVTQDYVNELKKYFNVVEIWMINDEQKAQVFESFVQYGFVQKVG